ncbi:head-tail connector protein [Duganella sp. LjRoot269]|uniref:head-tail connector protein n=1 Tax=Duganella sp. LjRoot269 TaxID=3342305 RepID=UPI003ECFE8C7
MTKIRTAAPTVLAVTLDSAKLALRIDGDDMDALVTMWVKGIVADLEQSVGQCMMEQTWEVHLPGFPGVPCWSIGQPVPRHLSNEVRLPHPVLSVTSVSYIDQAGTTQTLAPEAYRINRTRYASTLSPARGTSWPATAEDDAAVVVVMQCGYGSDPATTPEEVQLYILAKLAEQFDPAARMERDTVQSAFVNGLLDRCRSYG